MSSTPRVSVVIIFLNPGGFLREAVDSVCTQTFGDWELLLVDDGSTDGSSQIAQSLAEASGGRLAYLEHPGHANRGMSETRNLGLRHARGEYLAFLDADDVWLPSMLDQQVRALDQHPGCAMTYGPIEWWFSWAGPGIRPRDFHQPLGVMPDCVVNAPDLLLLWLRRRAAVPSGILIRREAVLRVNGFEASFPGLYEDQAFCAKICLQESIYVSSTCGYRYRQHPTSACAVARRSRRSGPVRHQFLLWFAGYLQDQGYQGSATWDVVQRELWPFRHPWLALPNRSARASLALIRRIRRVLSDRLSSGELARSARGR